MSYSRLKLGEMSELIAGLRGVVSVSSYHHIGGAVAQEELVPQAHVGVGAADEAAAPVVVVRAPEADVGRGEGDGVAVRRVEALEAGPPLAEAGPAVLPPLEVDGVAADLMGDLGHLHGLQHGEHLLVQVEHLAVPAARDADVDREGLLAVVVGGGEGGLRIFVFFRKVPRILDFVGSGRLL